MNEQKLLKKKRQYSAKGNKTQLAVTCNDLAELYMRQGKHDLAIREYELEARLYNEMGKRIQFAQVHRMIGERYMSLAEFDKALEYENIHLVVAKEEKNEQEEQRALASIGRTYLTKAISYPENLDSNSLRLASEAFHKSLAVCERLQGISEQEKMDMRARLLLNIGVIQENQGDFVTGTEYMMKSIKICKSYDIYDQLHQGYSTLAMLYCKKKDYKNALEYINFAVEVADRLSDKIPPKCTSLYNKADVLIKLGEYHSAKYELMKAYKLKTPNLEEQQCIERNLKVVAAMCKSEDELVTTPDYDLKKKKTLYEKLGDGSCQLESFEKAIGYYKKMLEFALASGESGKELTPVYVSLAQTYKDNKQYDLAVEYFQKEYEVCQKDPTEKCNTLLSIAQILELAKRPYEELYKVYSKARDQAHISGKMRLEGKVIRMFVNLQKKHNKFSEAAELEKELIMMNYVPSDSESEDDSGGTPDIGDDVNIDELSGVSSESDAEDNEEPRGARKRTNKFVMKKNNKGETPLHVACIQGNVTSVQSLINQGHVVNIREYCGWLPIHEASNHGHLEVVQILINAGAAVNDRGGIRCGGVTPLHDAALNGHLAVVELLLNCGASPLAQDDSGVTPLDMLKQYRSCTDLTPTDEALYEKLVQRMSSTLEKVGRPTLGNSSTNPINCSDKENVGKNTGNKTDDNLKSNLRKSPRIKTPLRQVGGLRRNVDVDTDDEMDPRDRNVVAGPSGLSCTRNLYRENSLSPHEPRRKMNRSLSPTYDESSESETETVAHKEYISTTGSRHQRIQHRMSPKKAAKSTGNDEQTEDWLDDGLHKDTPAQKEYKRAMENLRRGPKLHDQISPKKVKMPSLISEQEAETDWLEDDLGLNQPVKKRKKNGSDSKQNSFIDNTGMRKSDSFSSTHKSPRRMSRSSSFTSRKSSTGSPTKSGEEIEDIFENSACRNEPDYESSGSTAGSSTSKRRRRSNQASLLDSGFSRHSSDGSINFTPAAVTVVDRINKSHMRRQQKLSSFINNSEPDSTTNVIDLSQLNNTQSSAVTNMMAVNVRIESILWRIPVPANDIGNLTIGWLANEASKRYYRKEGISPNLQLETKEGALLVNEDPLSMVFLGSGQPDEVQSTVVSWNLPPLPERYIEACSSCKIAPNTKLREHLDECQGTLSLKLGNFLLERTHFVPLFRALNRQNNLQQIDLSNNALLNEGVQQLCVALPSLTQLHSLNLSLNNITGEGIRHLSELFVSKPILPHLTDLDLSFNLLGDDCLRHLTTILQKVKLRTLSLAGCNLTENVFDNVYNRDIQLNFNYLESLDVSYNDLNKDSLIMFVSFLNFGVLTNLNVAHNTAVAESGIVKEIAENLQHCNTCSVKSLNVARCKVNDSEIWDLLRSVSEAHELDCLNLSYNADLTSVSLRRLMQHRPSFSSIILEGCPNIVQYLHQCSLATFPSDCQMNTLKSVKVSLNYEEHSEEAELLASIWEREWGTRAKISKLFGTFMDLSVCD